MELPNLDALKINAQRPMPPTSGPQMPTIQALDEPNSGCNPLMSPPTELAAPVAPKSPEVAGKEEELRIIISLYKSKFGEELAVLGAELDSVALAHTDMAALESLRDRCDRILGAGSGCDNKRRTFNTCIYIIEKLGCYSGVHIEGLTAALLADREYQRDLTRLALKWLSANDCKPEYTVPMKILTTAVQIHMNHEIMAKKPIVEAQLATEGTAQKLAAVNAKYQDNIA